MKNIVALLVALVFLSSLTLSYSYAMCGMGGTKGAKEANRGQGIINDTCPVMGGKVDANTPYTAEYKGKGIGFCCEGCVKEFNKNPEKYTRKLGFKKGG